MIVVEGKVKILTKGSEIHIKIPSKESVVLLSNRSSTKQSLNVSLDDNSQLTIFSIHKERQQEDRATKIGKDSKMKWIDYCLASEVQIKTVDNLNAEGAETQQLKLFFGDLNHHFNIESFVNHNAANTQSSINTYGVLDGKSKADIVTLIKINSGATKSVAVQKDEILLMSKQAKANSLPQLEINEEDCLCNHGSAIGQIDRSKLFYLMSRGLSESDAKREIVKAFFEPVILELKEEKLICGLREIISNKIKK